MPQPTIPFLKLLDELPERPLYFLLQHSPTPQQILDLFRLSSLILLRYLFWNLQLLYYHVFEPPLQGLLMWASDLKPWVVVFRGNYLIRYWNPALLLRLLELFHFII